MIQLNLLPDVKLEFIKAQRARRLMLGIAIIVTSAAVGLLVLLLSLGALQKRHLSALNDDIKTEISTLQGEPDIAKILTVQNQLNSLTKLHEEKPAASRLFEYLNQVTPSGVDIANFSIKFTDQTITLTGGADSVSAVNKYIDTLKYTTYSVDGDEGKTPVFNNVVLTSFGISENASAGSRPATYTMNASYDQTIFNIGSTVKLSVPNRTTTRAVLDNKSDLFQDNAPTDAGGGN